MPCLRYKPAEPMNRASSQGFTLIEIVVALAIIAILASLATGGGIRSWLIQRGLSTAVEQLRGDMQRAKLLAIKQHANCTIMLNDPAANQYSVSLSNQVVDLGAYRGNVVFEGPGGPVVAPVPITFTPWGTCNIASCTFGDALLTNNGNTAYYRLRVTASGGIFKQVWNGAQWVSAGV